MARITEKIKKAAAAQDVYFSFEFFTPNTEAVVEKLTLLYIRYCNQCSLMLLGVSSLNIYKCGYIYLIAP